MSERGPKGIEKFIKDKLPKITLRKVNEDVDLIEKIGKEKENKLKGSIKDEVQHIVEQSNNKKEMWFLLDLMPQEIFEETLKKPEGKASEKCKLAQLLKRCEAYMQTCTPRQKFAISCCFAFGTSELTRFATTALFYGYETAQEDKEINDTDRDNVKTKLRHHYKEHLNRLKKLKALKPEKAEQLHFGMEIEIQPFTHLPDDRAQAAWGEFWKYEKARRNRMLLELGKHPRISTEEEFDEAMHQYEQELQTLGFNARLIQAETEEAQIKITKQIGFLTFLSGWSCVGEGFATPLHYRYRIELRSEPTADVVQLQHELVLLRKMGIVNYDRLDLEKAIKSEQHNVHISVGGLKPPQTEFLTPSDDVYTLMHTSEATALATTYSIGKAGRTSNVSIVKGELLPRDEKFKNDEGNPNTTGVELRPFQAYSELNLIKVLSRTAKEAYAIQLIQQLPDGTREIIDELTNIFEHEHEGRQEILGTWMENEGNQLKKVAHNIDIFGLSDEQKKILMRWYRFKYRATYLFMKTGLSDPTMKWGETHSSERAELYNLLGGHSDTFGGFKSVGKIKRGDPIRFDNHTYTNFIDAMRALQRNFDSTIAGFEE